MTYDFSALDALIDSALDRVFPAAQVQVRLGGEIVYDISTGFLDPEARACPTTAETRFDLASVSKLFTVVAFMTLVEAGRVQLDQPVTEVLPEFCGRRPIAPSPDPLRPGSSVEIAPHTEGEVDAGVVTFRQLLSHSAGLPAWLPLWKMAAEWQHTLPAAEVRRRLRETVFATAFAYRPGTRVVYSDIGLLLIGFAIERLAGETLRETVRNRVTAPLGLDSITYGPIPCDMAAPTELYAHQGRRMCGEVHDENAFAFGGVAGHAGLFGTAHDVAAFGEALRCALASVRETVLRQETLAEMVRLQVQEGDVRRGLGFALRSSNPAAMSYPLGEGAFGHLGFTGTALWVDPSRALVLACLTNHIYYGRAGEDTLTPFRAALARTVVECIQSAHGD
ncbi:MAG: esterase [Candidatus Roseilinea sp.]|nr:MAG: esterase [Candidatus Roseilinea sp.]GIV85674.1 MAG: esterase [Candidatus Roseilinea sp.]